MGGGGRNGLHVSGPERGMDRGYKRKLFQSCLKEGEFM